MRNKIAALAAAVAVGVIFTAAAMHDNSAQDAADYATRHGVQTCKAVR